MGALSHCYVVSTSVLSYMSQCEALSCVVKGRGHHSLLARIFPNVLSLVIEESLLLT